MVIFTFLWLPLQELGIYCYSSPPLIELCYIWQKKGIKYLQEALNRLK